MKNEDGIIPELNEANILTLDLPTIQLISTALTKLMVNDQDKKKQQRYNLGFDESDLDIRQLQTS